MLGVSKIMLKIGIAEVWKCWGLHSFHLLLRATLTSVLPLISLNW